MSCPMTDDKCPKPDITQPCVAGVDMAAARGHSSWLTILQLDERGARIRLLSEITGTEFVEQARKIAGELARHNVTLALYAPGCAQENQANVIRDHLWEVLPNIRLEGRRFTKRFREELDHYAPLPPGAPIEGEEALGLGYKAVRVLRAKPEDVWW